LDRKAMIVILAAMIIPATVSAVQQLRVKWVINVTSEGWGSPPKWNTPVYADLDGDGIQEIVTNLGEARVLVFKGTGVLDWIFPPLSDPDLQNVGKYQAIADIDQDGKLEVLAGCKTGVYCLGPDGDVEWFWEAPSGDLGYVQDIIVRDMNNDGVPELVVGSMGNPQLFVLDNKGQLVWKIDTVPPGGGLDTLPQAFDVDRDGDTEIIVLSRNLGDVNGAVICYSSTGVEKWRFEDPTMVDFLHSQPTIADINGDGEYEIVFGTWREEAGVIALTFYGTQIWRWYNPAHAQTGAQPVIWDVDGDGNLDIVMPCRGGYTACLDAATGEEKWGFNWSRTATKNTISNLLADMTGDGKLNPIFTSWPNATAFVLSNTGQLQATYHMGSQSTAGPVVGDLDGDGKIEMVAFADPEIYCLTLDAPFNPDLLIWPMHGRDTLRSGIVPIPEASALAVIGLLAIALGLKRNH